MKKIFSKNTLRSNPNKRQKIPYAAESTQSPGLPTSGNLP